MKVYVTGSNGLVGSRFLELLSGDFEIVSPEVAQIDITDFENLKTFFEKEKPDAVVHFAGFTDVSGAESERGDKNGKVWKVNVEGSKNIAVLCRENASHMIHISTDYVFSGSKDDPGPYSEDHKLEESAQKLTWYGYTKNMAEGEIKNILGNSLSVVRLIYPVRAKFDGKKDYIRKPLSLFDQGKLYPMFTDQKISITYIDEACQAIKKIIDGKIYGVFHASTPDTTSPFELISYVIEKTRGIKNAVKPSSLDEFIKTTENPARYPKYGGLKVENTEKVLGIKFSSWKEVVEKLINQGLN